MKEIITLSIPDPDWKLKAVYVTRPHFDHVYSDRLTGAWIDTKTATVNIMRNLPEPDNLIALCYDHLDTTITLTYVKLTDLAQRLVVKFHTSSIGLN